MPKFIDRDLIFSTEYSDDKVTASSKVGKAGSGSRLRSGDDGGVWVVPAGV